ncbi:MAG TPA: biopolymer transporter TolR, partial [Blastocatellia bacterium]
MFNRSFTTSILLAAALCAFAYAQEKPIGQFESHEDVGNPAKPGSVVYDAAKQTYAITGSGVNMWAGRDEFHYVWMRMKGNFILRARVEFLGKGVDPHRKIGWIARHSLEA